MMLRITVNDTERPLCVVVVVDVYLDKCKKLQFIHSVNSDGPKTAKILKRQC